MSKRILLPVLLLIALTLNGCWDRRELESLALVQSLGLDKVPGGKGITVTAMIAIPAKLKGGGGGGGGESGGGGGGGTGVFLISKQAPTIFEAFNLINSTVNREVSLLQNSIILFGEDLAKQGIQKWVDSMVRYRELRRTLNIFICQGQAIDIMKVKPKLEANPAAYFRDFSRLTRFSGMFPMTTLSDFMDRYEAKAQENYAPLFGRFHRQDPDEYQQSSGGGEKSDGDQQKGGGGGQSGSSGKPPEAKDVRVLGTAIFKGDKMVGTFDIYETQILEILTHNFHEAMLSIGDPLKKDCQISYRLMATGKPKIKYIHKNNQDRFQVSIKMEAELNGIQSGIDYSDLQKENLLSSLIAHELKARIQRVIKKAQQYNTDVFGFGIKVRNTILTGKDWDRYNWPDKFKNAKFDVATKVEIRRIGVQFQPPVSR
jgi:spore germination protein KC